MCGTMTISIRCGKCSELVSGEPQNEELRCPCGACVVSLKPKPGSLDID